VNERLKDISAIDDVPAVIVCLFSLVDEAVSQANAVLLKRSREYGLGRFMGTTVVGLVPVEGQFVLWFHVGDSRLYLWRDSALKRLTSDHSAYEEWKNNHRQGPEPGKHIITRAVGPQEGVVSDIQWDKWRQNDIYILCSDGLFDMIEDEEIARIVKEEKGVEDIAAQLVEAAIDAGGNDNTSVVVCKT